MVKLVALMKIRKDIGTEEAKRMYGDFAAACPNYWTLLPSGFLMAKPTANQQTRTFFSPPE